jgi:ATP-dependent exoDNAse (exonuclease V) alpha subunit
VAASAYRAGVKLEDHRTAMVFDFTRRSGVVATVIVAPSDAGAFARDRASLWNAAETAEKRKDARTAREWIVALPSELDAKRRIDLARAFAQELVERYGVVADVAVHEPSRGGDDRNHHAHILCTTRVVVGDALGEKSALELSDTNRKAQGFGPAAGEITMLRERWAALANATLEEAGQSARIDHRSLGDQQDAAFERGDLIEAMALKREPQQHVGVHATQLESCASAP